MSTTAKRWTTHCGARCAKNSGVTGFVPERVAVYVFRSERERELIYVHRTVYDGEVVPSDELDGGRFWSRDEIFENLGKGVFTPNFEGEVELVLGV